jgi:hypothetical protein
VETSEIVQAIITAYYDKNKVQHNLHRAMEDAITLGITEEEIEEARGRKLSQRNVAAAIRGEKVSIRIHESVLEVLSSERKRQLREAFAIAGQHIRANPYVAPE